MSGEDTGAVPGGQAHPEPVRVTCAQLDGRDGSRRQRFAEANTPGV
jgi:hypothetical protein